MKGKRNVENNLVSIFNLLLYPQGGEEEEEDREGPDYMHFHC